MMRQTRMKKTIIMGLFSFILAGILSACGRQENTAIPEKAFGVEDSQELTMQLPKQVICGQENAWAITAVKNDFIYQLGFDAGATGVEKLEWQPEEGNYSLINVVEYKGTLYAELENRENHDLEIRERHADGSWGSVMSIKPKETENYAVVGSGFFVDGNGNTYLVNGNSVTRYAEETRQAVVYELHGTVCSFEENQEGNVECVTAGTKGIVLYELGKDKAEEKWTFPLSEDKVHVIRCSEEGMLCLATDTELLFLEKESGKPIARTDFVKLGVPAPLAGYYDGKEETLRLYSLAGSGTEGLRTSLLSGRNASMEQRTKLVYGIVNKVNSDASSSIRTAINTFNQENKEYYVTIRDYDGNLERMQADMAAGKGPDLIDMMDSAYYESYAKSGYLENLLPYLEQSQYQDDIIWNVLEPYKIDGGLYLFFPQFMLDGILIHPKQEASIEEWNMETFLELVEKNRWEKDIFGGTAGDPQTLLRYMLYGRQEEFIDWEQKTAAFETEAFLDMLALCREYAQADWSAAKDWTYQEKQMNTLYMPVMYAGGFYSYLSYTEIYGREYSVYGYPTLTGQTYGITPGIDSCAIYSKSKQKEGAWEFVESLLWESNQNYPGIVNPGFPIRSSLQKEMAKENMTTYFGKEKLLITESEIAILEDIIYNGELSSTTLDPNIESIIREETAPYFEGHKNAQETAHIIQSRVQLILTE